MLEIVMNVVPCFARGSEKEKLQAPEGRHTVAHGASRGTVEDSNR